MEIKKFLRVVFDKKNEDHKKMLTLLGGLMIYFCIGTITIWGYINVYIASYFHSFDPDFSLKNANVIFTLFFSPLCISSIISLQLAEKIGFERQIRIATLLFSISVIISSYQTNFFMFSLFYGLFCSIAVGLLVTPIISTVWGSFPNIKGRISGYMFGMFGLSAMILVPIISIMVNPNNFKAQRIEGKVIFPIEVYEKVPDLLFKLGIFFLLFTSIGASLIRESGKIRLINKNESIGLNNLSKMHDEENIYNEHCKNFNCPSLKIGIFSKPFVIIFLCSFFMSLYSFYLHVNFKSYGLNKINDDHFITIVGFLNGVGALGGRIIFGHIHDKTTFQKLLLILEFFLAIFSITFPLVSDYAYLYAVWIVILAAIDGGIMCILGPGLIKIFGFEIGSKLYPIKQSSFYASMIIVPLLQLVLMKFVNVDSIFYLFAIGNLIAFIMANFLKEKYEWSY